MTYLCSLGTETAIFSVSLLTKKPFFWQVYIITSVLVFGMSHNIMFLLCVTKGQKILFLFKEVEKLSSVCILKDERVRKYCFCSMKLKRFSSILYDWMMIDGTHNWLRSFLKEYSYFYSRLWNIKKLWIDTLQTHPCNEDRVFPVYFFPVGKMYTGKSLFWPCTDPVSVDW